MLLVSKEAVPDHIRRGIRLGIAILILSSIGFSIVGREGCENWVPVFKWGLLTCPVVTMPLLGKTSQVSFERALGTVVGGTLGFFATALSTHWWTLDATETDDIFLSIVAASAAYLAIMVGKRLSLDLSSKLFTIAFILVCFSSQEGRDPKVVAITRVGGIVLGVVTMLILSVLVLPKSASIESLRTLRKSLNKLQDVNRIAWGNYLPPEHQAAQLVAAGASQAHEQQQRRVNGRARGEDSALAQPLLGPEDVEAGQPARPALVLDLDHGCASPMPPEAAEAHVAKSEKALIDLYSVMNQLAEQLALAKTEVWISNCNGRPFLLPGLPFWHRQTNHMPWRYLEEMAVAVRRVARLLNTAIFTFEDGFDQQLREVLGPWYPPALMPTLAAACYAAIQELCDAFPGETSASGQGLAAYSVAVQSLVDMSDQQRQRVKGAFKRHKSRVGARKSWASIIDSVLEEQRNQQLSVVKEDGEQQPRDADQWQPGEPGEGSPFGRAASVSGSEAGGTAVGGTASELIGGKAKGKHKREASFGNWIMRVSSSLGQQQGSLSGLDFAAAAAAATAAAAGDEETVSQNGSVAASVAGASEAGSQAGAGAAHGTSPVKLAGQAASAGRGVGLVGVLGSLPGGPFDVPAESAEQHLPAREPSLSFSVQPPPNMLSRASMLRQGGISFNPGNTMPLTLFPDTTQGRLAQVSFFSFMFLCEELREQLEGLHAAVDAVLLRLPS